MKRACLILLALLVCAPACKKKDADADSKNETEKTEKADEKELADEAEKAEANDKPDPIPATDDSNDPGGFRSPTEIALREMPFEPCRQIHKTEDGELIRTFEYNYEDGKLLSKLDLTADDTVRAAWSYDYDEDGQRIRAMRDDQPEGREMAEPDLIISYKWKDGKLTNSAWAFAEEPDETWRNTFSYDDEGRLEKVESDGFPADPPRDDNEPRVWTHHYDEKGYLMRRVRKPTDSEAPSRKTDFTYKNSKLAQQVHRADIQGEEMMQFDAQYEYDGDQLAQQTLEWGHENFGTEMITYEYECSE
ncbi:MAG: hypothetical protein ACQEVA_17645 [Myxococcota bacterium]